MQGERLNLARARDAALLFGLALVALGLARAPVPWPTLAPRIADAAAFGVAALVCGLLVSGGARRAVPAAVGALAVAVPLALAFDGLASLSATVLLVLGGVAAGTLLPRAAGVDPLARVVAGLALVVGVAGWLLPAPVHVAPVWAVALAALVLVRRRAVRDELAAIASLHGGRMRAAPWASLAWAVVAVIASAPAWLPIGNSDDLAFHLNLGNELLRYGHGRLDIGAESWALAPWATDLLHALVTVMAGDEGTGPLNAFWLVATGLLVQSLAVASGASVRAGWLASMLYISLPLTSYLTGSLQTEGATAAALAALALAIPGPADTRAQRLPLIAALAAFCLAAKVSNALLLVPFAVWLVASWWRSPPWRAVPASIGVGLLVAGSSYAYATLLTGSPIVPLLNAYFRTPWFPPENFVDTTWQTGFGPLALWRLVFDTSHYFEGNAGAAGVALIALLGGLPLALMRPAARAVTLVGVAALLIVFQQVQYARYLHPALAVLVPALVAGLLGESERRAGWREALLGAVVALQLALVPTASWMLGAGALRTLLTQGSRAVSDRFVPERALQARLRTSLHDTDRVLYTNPARSHGAELAGAGVGTAWFTPLVARVLNTRGTGADAWAEATSRAGANYVLAYELPSNPGVAAFLKARNAVRVDANGAAELYWLPPPAVRVDDAEPAADQVELDTRLDRPYPVMGQVVATLRCNLPGKPVAVAWTLPASPVQPAGVWTWATCDARGYATTGIELQAGARAGALHLSAHPAQPAAGDAVAIAGLYVDLRRDFAAETALYRWIWSPVCARRACDPARPVVRELAAGALVRYASDATAAADASATAPSTPPAPASEAAPRADTTGAAESAQTPASVETAHAR